MVIKKLIRRLVLGYKATSESYINHLKINGMTIGEDVIIFRPYNTNIDEQNPHMISIGDHVMITGPVTILAHDYSWCVLKGKYGDILGNQRRTSIGNNVFIGWGATILSGTRIGNNVIIGANSVVSGKVDDDSVFAGNPARKIMSIEEYYNKRKEKQLSEGVEFVHRYIEIHNCLPRMELLKEYFFLFAKEKELCPEFDFQLGLIGNKDLSLSRLNRNRVFDGYDEFINYCQQEMQNAAKESMKDE